MLRKKYTFMLTAFTCVATLIIGNIFTLQTFRRSDLLNRWDRQVSSPQKITAQRGDIKTSDGVVLATSVPVYNIYSDTRYIKDIEGAAKTISEFFELNYDETLKKINSNYYMELVKGINKETLDEFLKIKPRGIGYYQTDMRVYPNNSYMGNILGFLGNEGDGLSGLELSLNKYLKGTDGINTNMRDKNGNSIYYDSKNITSPINGFDTYTTINYNIQYQMEKSLKNAVEEHNAKKGLAITMDPNTGKVIGIAEYPNINPNNYKEYPSDMYKSSAVSMTYEPGSTYKPITVAIADALGVVQIEKDSFYDSGSYVIGNHRIGNWGKKAFGTQTAREILMNSSNVGTVQIAMKIPSVEFNNYQKKLGIGAKTGIEIPGEQRAILFSDNQIKADINKATNSFGQGITVTPIQLLTAWSTLINGGRSIYPHILERAVDENNNIIYSDEEKIKSSVQVIPETTSEKVKLMLEAVVKEGTGKRAQIPGYRVGGKTGTAQIIENGKYLKDKYKVSFVGFAPVESPQYLTMVMLDSPEESNASGGSMCAPAVKEILEYALETKGIAPSDPDKVNNNEVIKTEHEVKDYIYRLKDYVLKNPPAINYGFEGEGEIITGQNYVSQDGEIKVIFTLEKINNNGYCIMPNILNQNVSEFINIFKENNINLVVNGSKENAVTIQDVEPGTTINSKDSVVVWIN